MSRNLRRRVFRALDAACSRGAFDVSGSLWQVGAEAIADDLAAEWDGVGRGRLELVAATSGIEPDMLVEHVEAWLARNLEDLS